MASTTTPSQQPPTHHTHPSFSPAYMLPRDQPETSRLDMQHVFFTELFGSHLLHPQIPLSKVKTVADVGTGTGIWLLETAAMLRARGEGEVGPFVGFDISDAQFRDHGDGGARFVVHDITRPFPDEYVEFFDVVHVRLLTYALRAEELEKVVRNVVAILKPGGYLHWDETDVIDSYLTPEIEAMRRLWRFVVEERLERGLTPAMITPLVRTLTGLRTDGVRAEVTDQGALRDAASRDEFNTLTWNNKDVLRLLGLTTSTSAGHPSKFVQEHKQAIFTLTGNAFMQLGAARRRKLAAEPETSEKDRAKLLLQADEMESYIDHPDFEAVVHDIEATTLLAKKAKMSPWKGPWDSSMLS